MLLSSLKKFCYEKVSAKLNNVVIDNVDLHSEGSSLSLWEPVAKGPGSNSQEDYTLRSIALEGLGTQALHRPIF